MSGPFQLQRASGQLIDIQEQLPQMHKDKLFPVQEDKQEWQTYSVFEWGIPKSTHPNSEMYGICRQ